MLLETETIDLKSHSLKGEWRGIVVDNNDPLKINRVKVRIEGLMESENDKLPWATQKSSTGLGGSNDSSFFFIPKINSEVNVTFPFDDIHFPVYCGYYQSNQTHQNYFDDNYPHQYGFIDGGWKFRIDRQQNVLNIETASGVNFVIDGGGNITLSGPQDMVINLGNNSIVNVSSDATVNVGGDATIEAGGDVKIDGSEVILGSKISGITTGNSHLNVIDLITGVSVIPSTKVFSDV